MFDSNFNVAIPKEYNGLGAMSKEGLVSYSVVDAEGHHKYGFLNKQGKTVIAPQDGYVSGFYDGVSVKEYRQKFGAINTEGKFVIDTIYDILYAVGENRLVYGEIDYGPGIVYGLMDTRGRKITEPIFRSCAFYGDGGLMPVKNNITGIAGYINTKGKVVLPFKESCYKKAEPFYEGVAWVYKYAEPDAPIEDQVYGLPPELINMQGNELFSLKKGQTVESNYHNGLCLIHDNNDDSYQYINKQGEVIYRWTRYNGESNAQESQKPARLSEDEMMLKNFEGTEYYPLAEQCVRRKHFNKSN